jgi:hypothetical protein
MGQLKLLRKALGELTPDVVDWMLDSVNWWHFCQQVRVESGLHHVPPYPHIGFLLAHYPVGLRVMRSRLSNSNTGADFVSRFDQVRYEQMRTLVTVLADGIPERLAQIEAAKTLRDIQRVFIAIVDDNTVAPAKHLDFAARSVASSAEATLTSTRWTRNTGLKLGVFRNLLKASSSRSQARDNCS